jgi:hypothetical protein
VCCEAGGLCQKIRNNFCKYSCKNVIIKFLLFNDLPSYNEGCAFLSAAEFTKSHEAECRDRPFNCPFSVVVTKNSCWRGHISGLWSHILCKHTALAEPKEKFVLTVDCAEPGPLHRALHAKCETFLMVCRVINVDLYCCVLYVGPQERACC